MDANSKLSFNLFFQPLSTKASDAKRTFSSSIVHQSNQHKQKRNIIYFNSVSHAQLEDKDYTVARKTRNDRVDMMTYTSDRSLQNLEQLLNSRPGTRQEQVRPSNEYNSELKRVQSQSNIGSEQDVVIDLNSRPPHIITKPDTAPSKAKSYRIQSAMKPVPRSANSEKYPLSYASKAFTKT